MIRELRSLGYAVEPVELQHDGGKVFDPVGLLHPYYMPV